MILAFCPGYPAWPQALWWGIPHPLTVRRKLVIPLLGSLTQWRESLSHRHVVKTRWNNMSRKFFRKLCDVGDLSLFNPKSSPILTDLQHHPEILVSAHTPILYSTICYFKSSLSSTQISLIWGSRGELLLLAHFPSPPTPHILLHFLRILLLLSISLPRPSFSFFLILLSTFCSRLSFLFLVLCTYI